MSFGRLIWNARGYPTETNLREFGKVAHNRGLRGVAVRTPLLASNSLLKELK